MPDDSGLPEERRAEPLDPKHLAAIRAVVADGTSGQVDAIALLNHIDALSRSVEDLTAERDRNAPILQAAARFGEAYHERDRLLALVRNKRTRREFFRAAEALDAATDDLAALYPEGEPEPRHVLNASLDDSMALDIELMTEEMEP